MPKIKSPETFVPNQVLTASALQNHVDGANVEPGIITDFPAYGTANTVASNDKLLISDTSDTAALKAVNASEILNSGLAVTSSSVTTSVINGAASADLVITPPANHKVDIVGNIEADDVNVTDDLTVGDDATISGDLSVTGTSTFTGNATFNGNANIIGNLQVNGQPISTFVEVVEENIPNALGAASNTLHNLFTSASYTKPAGEVWIVELDIVIFTVNNSLVHFRLTNSSDIINYCVGYFKTRESNEAVNIFKRAYLNSSNTHSGTFVFRTKCSQPNIYVTPNLTQLSTYPDGTTGSIGKFRIYKYKT